MPEVEIVSLLSEELPRYRLRADYLTEFGGYANSDWGVVATPVLQKSEAEERTSGLSADQAAATLDYFVSCGDRLSQMTRAYHDVEAVSRLLQEKEKDLELAAKIGQELLERNRRLEDRVGGLEAQINSSTELITQLRHELAVKTDLLHVYTNDAIEEASPVELRNVNVDLMQRKVKDLEDENKRLHQEATELAKEAYDCEEKEEKLVSDAVKHLTEANVQINYLSEEFIVKSDESRRQKEEITHLLAQVCDVQSKLKRSNGENEELSAQLRIYKETQDELTAELADFKEKYREIVDLLHDTQEELKSSRKRTYPGAGQHDVSGMFACNPSSKDTAKKGTDDISLQSEIHSSLRSSKRTSKRSSHQSSKLDSASDFSDSDLDFSSSSFRHHKSSSLFKNAFSTYKLATANKMPHGGGSNTSPVPITQGYNPGQGSSLDNSYLTTSIPYMPDDNIYSYTVSRDMSRSPTHFSDIDNHESLQVGGDFDTRPSDTLTVASGGSKCLTVPYLGEQPKRRSKAEEDSVLKVQTVGELRAPMQSAGDSLALALPLGSVPGTNMMQRELGSIPSLGAVPGCLGSVPGHHEEEEQYELTSLTMEPTTTLLEVPKSDSGVTSGDFSEIGGLGDRNVADGMEATMGFTRDWIESSSSDLEQVLQKITPAEVERRRKKLHNNNYSSFDLGSDGFDSPGSLLGKPGFHFLPYGVRTPDSIMSTGSRDWTSSSAYGAGWKLPDKLRIVKPLEGSLTLHNWQRLAMPSLGGILEERRGVAVKGSFAHQQYLENRDKNDDDADNFMMDMLSDLEEDNNEDQEDVALRLKSGATRLQQTLTDSHILHPEVVSDTTNSYNRPQMSTTSLCSSRASSRRHSVSHGTSTFSTNLGLARVLNERNIYGGSTLSIDQISLHSGVASISSLTPSVMNSPDKLRSFTPTGTPLNSPAQSPPGTPPNEPSRRTSSVEESGLVLGFFASLRSALYGEQQKEVKTLMRKKRHHHKKCGSGSKKLGILERVEEVGVERFMSPAPVGLSDYSSDTDFFDGDHDELVDIQPGSLTLGSASKRPNYLKNKQPSSTSSSSVVSGRGPGRVVSPGDKRPALPGGYGVPGQPGTGALEKSPCVNVRTDLGFVPSTSHHLERHRGQEQGSFIGNIATMFFGRKGGLF